MNDAFSFQTVSSPNSEMDRFSKLKPNPLTQAIHKREVFWQIILPVILMSFFLIAIAVLICVPGQDSTSLGKDISLIFLILLAVPFVFILLALLTAVTYGLIKLIIVLPPYTHLVQEGFLLIQHKITFYADKAAEPIFLVNSWKSGAQTLTKNIIKKPKINKE